MYKSKLIAVFLLLNFSLLVLVSCKAKQQPNIPANTDIPEISVVNGTETTTNPETTVNTQTETKSETIPVKPTEPETASLSSEVPPIPAEPQVNYQLPKPIPVYNAFFGFTGKDPIRNTQTSDRHLIISSMEELEDFLQNDIEASVCNDFYPQTLIEITDKYTEDFFKERFLVFFSVAAPEEHFFCNNFYVYGNDEFIQVIYDNEKEKERGDKMLYQFFLLELPGEAYRGKNMKCNVSGITGAEFYFEGQRYSMHRLLEFNSYQGTAFSKELSNNLIQTEVVKKLVELYIEFYSVPGRSGDTLTKLHDFYKTHYDFTD